MEDGDKLYLANVLDGLIDGRVVAFDFEARGDNQVEVPVLTVQSPDGRLVKLLIYKDDGEDAPGWLELGE